MAPEGSPGLPPAQGVRMDGCIDPRALRPAPLDNMVRQARGEGRATGIRWLQGDALCSQAIQLCMPRGRPMGGRDCYHDPPVKIMIPPWAWAAGRRVSDRPVRKAAGAEHEHCPGAMECRVEMGPSSFPAGGLKMISRICRIGTVIARVKSVCHQENRANCNIWVIWFSSCNPGAIKS